MVLKHGCKHLTAQQRDWMLFSQEKDLKMCVFYYSCYSVLYNDQQGDYQLGEGVHLCVIACVCVCVRACVCVCVCVRACVCACVCVLISNCLIVNKPANGSVS